MSSIHHFDTPSALKRLENYTPDQLFDDFDTLNSFELEPRKSTKELMSMQPSKKE